MLGMKEYPTEYIRSCRARVDADLAAYRGLNASSVEFEASHFNNMVLVLDAMFMHRLRTIEGKDGNPLDEVRVICESLLLHGGALTPEKTIKLSPDKSVLGLQYGDAIALAEAQFARLSEAFFREIESKFSSAQLANATS